MILFSDTDGLSEFHNFSNRYFSADRNTNHNWIMFFSNGIHLSANGTSKIILDGNIWQALRKFDDLLL